MGEILKQIGEPKKVYRRIDIIEKRFDSFVNKLGRLENRLDNLTIEFNHRFNRG